MKNCIRYRPPSIVAGVRIHPQLESDGRNQPETDPEHRINLFLCMIFQTRQRKKFSRIIPNLILDLFGCQLTKKM